MLGKGQLISNINACEAVCEILKTTLGPRGMDKLIHEQMRGFHFHIFNFRLGYVFVFIWTSFRVCMRVSVTITNDGATIISLLDIVHPAAKTLVDIARSQV